MEPWKPTPQTRISSPHVVGNKKGDEVTSSSSLPRILLNSSKLKIINSSAAVKRNIRLTNYRHFLNKSKTEKLPQQPIIAPEDSLETRPHMFVNIDQNYQTISDYPMINNIKSERELVAELTSTPATEPVQLKFEPDNSLIMPNAVQIMKFEPYDIEITETKPIIPKTYSDQGCQAEIFFPCYENQKTFVCNRYMGSWTSDVEIQTEIFKVNGLIQIENNKKYIEKGTNTSNIGLPGMVNKACVTETMTADKECGLDTRISDGFFSGNEEAHHQNKKTRIDVPSHQEIPKSKDTSTEFLSSSLGKIEKDIETIKENMTNFQKQQERIESQNEVIIKMLDPIAKFLAERNERENSNTTLYDGVDGFPIQTMEDFRKMEMPESSTTRMEFKSCMFKHKQNSVREYLFFIAKQAMADSLFNQFTWTGAKHSAPFSSTFMAKLFFDIIDETGMLAHVKESDKRKQFADHMKEVIKSIKQRFRRLLQTYTENETETAKELVTQIDESLPGLEVFMDDLA